MAAAAAAATTPTSLFKSPSLLLSTRFTNFPASLHFSSLSASPLRLAAAAAIPSRPPRAKKANSAATAVAEEEKTAANDGEVDGALPEGTTASPRTRPCELYVCNLPRSCDITQLLDLFSPYGTVISVEVTRDAATGISRGCGFVTMGSIAEAKAAIAALDGSDLGGREMRVNFSADMVSGRRNIEALNAPPKKDIVFESPYKVYVGNLAWSVQPQDLREHFSQCGTVVSTRVLYDRKGGKNRVYGFLSFSSADELNTAMKLNETDFHGRLMLVREVINREEA